MAEFVKVAETSEVTPGTARLVNCYAEEVGEEGRAPWSVASGRSDDPEINAALMLARKNWDRAIGVDNAIQKKTARGAN